MGIDYSCCSEKCGVAFLTNPKRKAMDKKIVEDKIAYLQHQLKYIT